DSTVRRSIATTVEPAAFGLVGASFAVCANYVEAALDLGNPSFVASVSIEFDLLGINKCRANCNERNNRK
ncbi:MAG: hypothetical protein KDD69_09675, partial [Bdellovibrionales bacterium]|nr:hypothetical protein [Bdellovibrionales bacterium]